MRKVRCYDCTEPCRSRGLFLGHCGPGEYFSPNWDGKCVIYNRQWGKFWRPKHPAPREEGVTG